MQIDPFPVRLEQELKYALAYAALVSAVPQTEDCLGTSASARMLVMPGNAAFCAEKFSGSRE